jgi:hypothetical protein
VDLPALFNFCEAALWVTISAVLFWKWAALRKKPLPHPFGPSLPFAFLAFGVSDLIETQTGAWWRPWWLLLLKAACVLVIFSAWLHYRKSRPKKPDAGP